MHQLSLRSMKYITLLLFAITISAPAVAQEYIIKLNPVEDTVVKNRNFFFDAVEDGREQGQGKRVVGHFGKNDKTSAVLEGDLEFFFLDYLTKVYPKRSSDIPYTLRVNTIECSSTGGMLSEAKVKMDIDIVHSATSELVTNLTLEKTRQPLMGGKTFGVLIEEILAAGVEMIKSDKTNMH
ncbi:hypothetical protein BH11BAC1_BH11BAC1_11060 [soil metagenome]